MSVELKPVQVRLNDEAYGALRLLAEGACPALVVHRVHAPAITCGRAQMKTIDNDAIARSGLALVPRGSGGGPVLWDDDLIAIDVILPTGHPLLPVDVVEAYRTVTDPALHEVVSALQGHQVDALTFASPSAVRNFMSALRDAGVRPEWLTEQGPVVASIGPVTSVSFSIGGVTNEMPRGALPGRVAAAPG